MKENIWISDEQLNLIEGLIAQQNVILRKFKKEYYQVKKEFLNKYKKVWLVQKWFDKNYQDMKEKMNKVSYKYFYQKESYEFLIQIYFHIINIVDIYQMIFESIANSDQILTKTAYINLQMKYNMFYALVYNIKYKIDFENSLIRTENILKNIEETADELFNEENYCPVSYNEILEQMDYEKLDVSLNLTNILEKAIAESWHYEDYKKLLLTYKKIHHLQSIVERKFLPPRKEPFLPIEDQANGKMLRRKKD